MKVHLDTDIGGDMDDLCALALLLKLPDIEITGITTAAEDGGRRAGFARHVLDFMGRADIPVAAGADVSAGYYRYETLWYPTDEDNWGEPIPPQPGSPAEAVALLKRSIEQGAVIIGIGAYTNLRLLEEAHPGSLRRATLYLMGGHIDDNPPGYPQWGSEVDFNLQVDVYSAKYVLQHSQPTLVPLSVTCQTALRRAHLARLGQAGRLGELIVRQAERHDRSEHYDERYGRTCPGLPADIINFQHDPLTCALAVGWREGVTIETMRLRYEIVDGWLVERRDPKGSTAHVVTQIDADAFNAYWCDVVCG